MNIPPDDKELTPTNTVRFEYVSEAMELPTVRVFVNGTKVHDALSATVESKDGRIFVSLEFEAQIEVAQVEQ